MYQLTLLERSCLSSTCDRRRHRQFTAAVLPLEDRRLLSTSAGGDLSLAVMTQTATFPNIESLPNVSTQAILYFNSKMGTLTEVDLVTSGSFSAEFQAENLPTTTTINATASDNVSINVPNVPTGDVPVLTIPSVNWTFNGKDSAPVTSNSTPETAVLTSSADLAAFTGNFRIPISVSNKATTSSSAGDGDLSAQIKTQTSATITVIYYFIPNLPSLNPPSSPNSGPLSSTATSSTNGVGTSGTTSSSTISASNTVAPSPTSTGQGTGSSVAIGSTQNGLSPGHLKKNVSVRNWTPFHPAVHHLLGRHPRPAVEHLRATKVHVAHT